MPRKWIEVNDLSGGQYSVNKKIRSKTPMYRSDVFDYSDVNIVIKWKITVEGTNNVNKINKNLAFKNNAPLKSWISKNNNTLADNAEDLDIMSIYNLPEWQLLWQLFHDNKIWFPII